MSISEKLTTIKNSLEDIKESVIAKGQTPSGNITTYATAIDNIDVVNNTTTTITPTTSSQTVSPDGDYTGFSEVTVDAVTSAIDNNITAGNIKSGVSILGVSGSVVELEGETKNESLTSSSGNTFTPSSGKNGITSITVTPNNESRTVTPTTSQQTLSVNSGYSGNGTVTVDAVTSSIDSNISAGNIKNGVSILGVTGNYTGTTPTLTTKNITTNGTYTASSDNADGYSSVTVNVSGGGGSSTKYGVGIGSILGDIDSNGVLQHPSDNGNLVFTNLKDFSSEIFQYKFYYNPAIKSVSFPDLVTVSYAANKACSYAFYGSGLTSVDLSALTTIAGDSAFFHAFQECRSLTSVDLSSLTTISEANGANYMFYNCSSLTSISLPNLTTISASSGANRMFSGCSSLTSVTLPSLTTLTGSGAMAYCFEKCTNLTSISFPALTSTSFGTNNSQLNALCSQVTGCTVHFPSNIQSVISNWSSYQTGFGGNQTTVLFDLPATT